MLSLPAGVAAFGDSPRALIPATAIFTFLGFLSSYSFYTIGKLCQQTESSSMAEAWTKIVGKDSSWLISLCCFITPLGAALAYSIILGDIFSNLAKTVGLTGVLAAREASILLVTSGLLYPLCMLKNLSALAPVSVIGIGGVLVTAAFMAVRMLGFANPATAKVLSAAVASPKLLPKFGTANNFLSPSVLVLVSMGATAYLAHFNAPDFYNELKENSMKRFKLLSGMGFLGTALVSIAVMCFGFATFGANSSGVILNNYASSDLFACFCRVLMGVSIIGSYPFVFSGMKNGFLQLYGKDVKDISEKENTNVVRAGLGAVTVLALLLKNAGFVVSFNGAVMGSAIIYLFPSMMFLKKNKGVQNMRVERLFNQALVALGVVLGVVGGAVTVLSSFFPHLL